MNLRNLILSLLLGVCAVRAQSTDDPLSPWRSGVTIRPVDSSPDRHSIHSYFNTCPESPDGTKVLYYTSTTSKGQQGELRVKDRLTGEEKVIAQNLSTEDAHRVACQQWASGGKRVVFHNERDGAWMVCAVDLETGKEQVLAKERLLSWGQRGGDLVPIYGKHWAPGEHRDLELLNVSTGEIRKVLTAEAVTAQYPDYIAKKFEGKPISIFFPVLNADASRVFFKLASARNGNPYSSGASVREGLVAYDLAAQKFLFLRQRWGHPAWHPDNRTIVETAFTTIDSNTGKETRTPGLPPVGGDHPTASPDGKLFVTDSTLDRFGGSSKEWGIVLADARGGQYVILHRFDNSQGARSWRPSHPHPVFSPDGRRIYFNVSSGPFTRLHVAEIGQPQAQWIDRAGNTDDENERLAALQEGAKLPGIDEKLRAEAAALADFVQRWNAGGLKAYMSQVKGKPPRALGEYEFGVAADSPLRPIAELYRGRMLAWNLIENSNVRTNPVDARWFKDEAVKSFQRVNAVFSHNRVARMYLGEAIQWPKTYPAVADAPEWAVLQREQLDRLRDIIVWWIEKRQKEDGSFGGGWGDDCEMWRWWSSVLLGFDDPQITAAQLKFSKAAVARPHLKGGFNTEVTDVEHAAEDTTDNLIPLMVLEPQEPRWNQWALSLGNFMREVWTASNERGQSQFKSFYFSATATAPQPYRAYDVLANVGALHPALLAWQRTGDAKLGAQICAWLDTWVDATARGEGGKPEGILPAAIRWPDGAVTGAEGHWWEPVKPGGYMHSYYVWPSVITELTDALMLAHVMTGQDKYLAPLRSMAAIRLKYLRNPPAAAPAPGSETWCAEQLAPRRNANSNTGGLAKSLARFQALTGTPEFDELLAREGAEFVIRTDEAGRRELVVALRESAAALRVNFPGFTGEVRSTDRCMRFVQFLAKDYAFDEYRGVMQPKHELLYRMVTGDKNAPRFPQMAVRWRTPPKDMAAFVTAANPQTVTAELFHFGPAPRRLNADLLALKPGQYRVRLSTGGETRELSGITVARGIPASVSLELPPQALCILDISPLP